jgi:hypothetical protein
MDSKAISEIVLALDMRINYIQTGQVHLSASDVESMKSSKGSSFSTRLPEPEGEVKALSVDQMRMIVYLEDLKKKLLAM